MSITKDFILIKENQQQEHTLPMFDQFWDKMLQKQLIVFFFSIINRDEKEDGNMKLNLLSF